MTNPQKSVLRKQCLQWRRELTDSEHHGLSKLIGENISSLDVYLKAQRIGFYQAFGREVDLSALQASAQAGGKHCYLPVIHADQTFSYFPVTPHTVFRKNQYGIDEPVSEGEGIEPDALDLILIPLVVFDDAGNRIGMGKGYYDRTLASCSRAVLMGVGYGFQHQAEIPSDPWDVKLNVTVTEQGVFWARENER